MMYCPQCQKNVETKKEDFRIGLAILLIVFTGGFGLLIYVAIYLDKAKNRCIHCNSLCQTQIVKNSPLPNYQVISASSQPQKQQTILELQPAREKAKYCFNCGVELNQSEEAKFCALCGSNVE
ncbi:MAG: LITAF-like zinc ribbon domain-containing protein [Promethearchaeota archaeon]